MIEVQIIYTGTLLVTGVGACNKCLIRSLLDTGCFTGVMSLYM